MTSVRPCRKAQRLRQHSDYVVHNVHSLSLLTVLPEIRVVRNHGMLEDPNFIRFVLRFLDLSCSRWLYSTKSSFFLTCLRVTGMYVWRFPKTGNIKQLKFSIMCFAPGKYIRKVTKWNASQDTSFCVSTSFHQSPSSFPCYFSPFDVQHGAREQNSFNCGSHTNGCSP